MGLWRIPDAYVWAGALLHGIAHWRFPLLIVQVRIFLVEDGPYTQFQTHLFLPSGRQRWPFEILRAAEELLGSANTGLGKIPHKL